MNTKSHFACLTSARGFLATTLFAGLIGFVPAVHAAGTWDGGGADSNFTTAANWVGDATPSSPYDLIVMAGNTRTSVNFASPATFGQAAITSTDTASLLFKSTATSSFTLSGSTLTIDSAVSRDYAGAIVNVSGRQQTINNDITLSGSTQAGILAQGDGSILTINGNINAGSLTNSGLGVLSNSNALLKINGVISGSVGGVTANGNPSGVTEINGVNTYKGGTVLFSTTVKISHDALLNTDGAFGNSSATIQMGSSTGNLFPTLLTNGEITVARSFFLVSTGANPVSVYTLGGSTADISTYSGQIALQTDGSTKLAENLTVTAAAGGRVNFTGDIYRAALSTGTLDTLTKTGAGIVALSGTVNNQGANTVSVGTLLVNGTLATNGADVAVSSAATLGGKGTINRSVSIAAGGILSAGDMSGTTSLVGTLTLGAGTTSGLTLANTSEIKFDLQHGNFALGGGINDLITVGGQLTLDGTLRVTELGGSLTNGTYRLFDYTGALTNNTLVIDATFLAAHVGSTIDTSVANQINLQVVPEPSTWALVAFSLTTFVVLRRRRIA